MKGPPHSSESLNLTQQAGDLITIQGEKCSPDQIEVWVARLREAQHGAESCMKFSRLPGENEWFQQDSNGTPTP